MLFEFRILTLSLLLLNISLVLSLPITSKPLENTPEHLAWEAWVMAPQKNNKTRKVTPKSIFVLPNKTISTSISQTVRCPPGHKLDSFKCIPTISIDRSQILITQLQNLFHSSDKNKNHNSDSSSYPYDYDYEYADSYKFDHEAHDHRDNIPGDYSNEPLKINLSIDKLVDLDSKAGNSSLSTTSSPENITEALKPFGAETFTSTEYTTDGQQSFTTENDPDYGNSSNQDLSVSLNVSEQWKFSSTATAAIKAKPSDEFAIQEDNDPEFTKEHTTTDFAQESDDQADKTEIYNLEDEISNGSLDTNAETCCKTEYSTDDTTKATAEVTTESVATAAQNLIDTTTENIASYGTEKQFDSTSQKYNESDDPGTLDPILDAIETGNSFVYHHLTPPSTMTPLLAVPSLQENLQEQLRLINELVENNNRYKEKDTYQKNDSEMFEPHHVDENPNATFELPTIISENIEQNSSFTQLKEPTKRLNALKDENIMQTALKETQNYHVTTKHPFWRISSLAIDRESNNPFMLQFYVPKKNIISPTYLKLNPKLTRENTRSPTETLYKQITASDVYKVVTSRAVHYND